VLKNVPICGGVPLARFHRTVIIVGGGRNRCQVAKKKRKNVVE
jgi:hypothetical protein